MAECENNNRQSIDTFNTSNPIIRVVTRDTSNITPSIVANHDRLLRKIPQASIHLWIENCRRILINYLQPTTTDNHQGKLDSSIQLLLLPSKVLGCNNLRLGTKTQRAFPLV
jgi:hypothetical protein